MTTTTDLHQTHYPYDAEVPPPDGAEPAEDPFPLGDPASGPDRTVVDLTFHGDGSTHPVISQLARRYNVDVSILGAALGTYDGRQVGRMRIELPGRFEDNVVPIGFLREQGLQVEVAEPAGRAAPAGADR